MGYASFPNPLIRHAAPPAYTCIITHSLTHDLAFLFTLGIPRFSHSTYFSPLSGFVWILIPLIILPPSFFNPLPQAPTTRFIIPYRLSINTWHRHLNPQEGSERITHPDTPLKAHKHQCQQLISNLRHINTNKLLPRNTVLYLFKWLLQMTEWLINWVPASWVNAIYMSLL